MQNSDSEDPVEMYLRELANVEPLPDEEMADLFRKVLNGEYAKKRLIEAHLRLVVEIAETYASTRVPKLDLIQYGNLGLMRAVDDFAQKPVGNFIAYAKVRINDEIVKFVKTSRQT